MGIVIAIWHCLCKSNKQVASQLLGVGQQERFVNEIYCTKHSSQQWIKNKKIKKTAELNKNNCNMYLGVIENETKK